MANKHSKVGNMIIVTNGPKNPTPDEYDDDWEQDDDYIFKKPKVRKFKERRAQ